MKPEMSADGAVEIVQLLENAGIEVWLDGGWAVDAALGEQTRTHKDLDIILRMSDIPALEQVLFEHGFSTKDGGTETNFVLAKGLELEVDVHGIVFDEAGNGVYRMGSGSDWIFPADGFKGTGSILGRIVKCLTPDVQVLCHAHGYVPSEKDFRDMELLKERFGLELPSQLRRPE